MIMHERPEKLLLIDDDPSFLRALAMSLKDLAETCCLSDARQIDAHLPMADVVVTDYRMIGHDGTEVLRLARAHDPQLPVILITAHATKEMAIQAANLHAFAILEKPVDFQAVRAVITRALAHRRETKMARHFQRQKPMDIELNDLTLVAIVDGQRVQLTDIEYRLLSTLLAKRGQRIPRTELIRAIWGSSRVAENALDTHLGNLKKKLPQIRDRLQVVRGKGYIYGI